MPHKLRVSWLTSSLASLEQATGHNVSRHAGMGPPTVGTVTRQDRKEFVRIVDELARLSLDDSRELKALNDRLTVIENAENVWHGG